MQYDNLNTVQVWHDKHILAGNIFVPYCPGPKHPGRKFLAAIFTAYQSLACETAINTEFSELFSLKRIYVKYKNAILSLIDCFFRTWKD